MNNIEKRSPQAGQFLKFLLPLFLLLAFWPVLNWLFRSITRGGLYGPEDVISIFSALLILLELHWTRQPGRVPEKLDSNKGIGYLTCVVALYIVLQLAHMYFVLEPLPMLVQEALFIVAVAPFLSQYIIGSRFNLSLFALLFYCLPLYASLEFFFSFPFRLFATAGAAALLSVTGIPTSPHETSVFVGHLAVPVSIEPACSGLRFFFAGQVLACFLSLRLRFGPFKTIFVCFAALILALGANILRIASLSVLACSSFADILNGSGRMEIAHEAIGVSCFIVTLVAAFRCFRFLRPVQEK